MDEAEFSKLHAGVKRGDIVGIIGIPGPGCFDVIINEVIPACY